MVHTIYVETDVPGELGRIGRDIAELSAGPILIVLPEIRVAAPGVIPLLNQLLTGERKIAVLLSGRVPAEVGAAVIGSGCPLFVTPRAWIGSDGQSGTELSATGVAELVRTAKHASARITAAGGVPRRRPPGSNSNASSRSRGETP